MKALFLALTLVALSLTSMVHEGSDDGPRVAPDGRESRLCITEPEWGPGRVLLLEEREEENRENESPAVSVEAELWALETAIHAPVTRLALLRLALGESVHTARGPPGRG